MQPGEIKQNAETPQTTSVVPVQRAASKKSTAYFEDNRSQSAAAMPTTQLKGPVSINDDESLEKEADTMGAKALQRKSATHTGVEKKTGGFLVDNRTPVTQLNPDENKKKREDPKKSDIDKFLREAKERRFARVTEDRKEKRRAKLQERREDLMAQQSDDYSPQEIGMMAAAEIRSLADQSKDMYELASHFEALQFKYGLKNIGYNTSKDPITVQFQVNPHFEVKLAGSHAVEMRSEGSGTGTEKTKVRWTTQSLDLKGHTPPGDKSFTVGKNMVAYPLSSDHAPGSNSSADSDHTGMMGMLPSKGNRTLKGSGSGPYFYIKGHLLNDNIGGIANEANLFPITHEANGQHKTYVEEYIKKGIEKGYVYGYEVDISNISTGYEAALKLYTVDAHIDFQFARLDTAGKPVSGTSHTGTVKSTYKTTGAEPFDKSTEYAKDYGISYNHPKDVGGEAKHKTTENAPLTSNTGLTSNVTTFGYGMPGAFSSPLSGGTTTTTSMSISTSASLVPTDEKLSLVNSAPANVIKYFEDLVTGWPKTDITKWVGNVSTNKYSTWKQVFDDAEKNCGLAAGLADKIKNSYLVRVSIKGAAVGT